MKKAIRLSLGAALLLAGMAAQPLMANTVITTVPAWDGNINAGWAGSGQSLTVPVDNFFESFTVYADENSNGQHFSLYIRDAQNGGSDLFSVLNQGINTGANTFNINQAFTAGSTIFVQFDYNGFNGQTLHYGPDAYAGGLASFTFGDEYQVFGLDLEFTAVFSGGSQSVPDGGSTFALMGLAVAGIAALRRKQGA